MLRIGRIRVLSFVFNVQVASEVAIPVSQSKFLGIPLLRCYSHQAPRFQCGLENTPMGVFGRFGGYYQDEEQRIERSQSTAPPLFFFFF
jgi:hypothetical protein